MGRHEPFSCISPPRTPHSGISQVPGHVWLLRRRLLSWDSSCDSHCRDLARDPSLQTRHCPLRDAGKGWSGTAASCSQVHGAASGSGSLQPPRPSAHSSTAQRATGRGTRSFLCTLPCTPRSHARIGLGWFSALPRASQTCRVLTLLFSAPSPVPGLSHHLAAGLSTKITALDCTKTCCPSIS